MYDEIYDQQDMELTEMVNTHARRMGEPVKAVLVPVSTVREYQNRTANRAALNRISSVAARLGLGLLCIGAMARNMMDPILAIGAAGACCIWAAAGYWRAAYAKVHGTR